MTSGSLDVCSLLLLMFSIWLKKKRQSTTRLNKCDLVDNEPPIFINIPSG